MQPLGDLVDKEVGDGELTEIPVGERFVLLPQALGDLARKMVRPDLSPRRPE
jgi:hypothetical protein